LGAAKGQEQIPALALCAGVYGDATPISERGDWVKIFATGGVGAAKEDVLLPTMSEEAFQSAIRKIHEMGKKAAIHTWGGKSLDWSIEAGADSVEHCVYMTEEQAERLAEKQITYVPTARIYQLIADPHSYLALPEAFVEHAKAACQGHQKAVWYGKKKGVIMAFGTDFYSDPRLLEQELEEIFALADYGLSMEEIWKAGTENAALALGLENSHGKIAVGYVADAVLYDKDPYQAENGDALKAFIRKIF
jgi:imidazolonepropionase-like amidohydrolase